jgi:hypothetical protein
MLKNGVRKLEDNYVPPYALVEDVNYDQVIEIVRYEMAANFAGIEALTQAFFELNCSERMSRRLSAYVVIDGKRGQVNKPSDWQYVPQEGGTIILLKLLCPMQ